MVFIKNAGIRGATSHSGRRTGLTNLAERGVGVRVLMTLVILFTHFVVGAVLYKTSNFIWINSVVLI